MPDPRQFDELAAACAAAFAAGDAATGDRLFVELYAIHLEPDLRRRLRYFAWNPQVREEAWSRVLDQIYARMLRRGKAVEQRWLSTIYRRCTFDELGAVARHAGRAERIGADDDLERIIAAGRRDLAGRDEASIVALRADVDRLIDHVTTNLGREQWGTVLRAMTDGHVRGSDIAHATGMTQVRVRQVKMELARYVRGEGRALLDREAA